MASNTIAEDRMIIWFDSNRDFTNEQNQKYLSQLRSIINTIETFADFKKCMNYLEQNQNKDIFLILSNNFSSQIATIKDRCIAVYIFCNENSNINKNHHTIFTNIDDLCNDLRIQVRQLESNSQPITVISASSVDNLNQLKPSFMYLHLLKENFLKTNHNREKDMKELVEYCRQIYKNDKKQLETISEFEKTYGQKCGKSSIWWYTNECFVYRKLNEALRTMNVGLLSKFGFYIKDLHKQLVKLHSDLDMSKIPSICYRGQGIFHEDFQELKVGSLLSFDCFLSTSEEKKVAERFARYNQKDMTKKSVLFEIKLDTSIKLVPFAPIEDFTAIYGEKEILFSLCAVFRIGKIEQNRNTKLWEVELLLTSDRDPLLERLTEHIQRSLGNGNELRQRAQLMIKMNQLDEAKRIYELLLETVDQNDKAENAFLHNQLGYIFKQQGKLAEAFAHYQQALQINQAYMSSTDPRLSSIYSNIGGILKKLGNANEALTCYQYVLEIDLAVPKPNQLEIAIDYNNIGSVLDDLGRYPEALKNYEEASRIKLSHLPPNHPSLASTFCNMGLIHRKMGHFEIALQLYKDALEVQQKSLVSDNPLFIITYRKLATVLEDLHDYKQAIDYAEKALQLAEKVYSSQHPETDKCRQYLAQLRSKH